LEELRAARERWSHLGATRSKFGHSKQLSARATDPTEEGFLGDIMITTTSPRRGGGSRDKCGDHALCFFRPVSVLPFIRDEAKWSEEHRIS
jgi:hypothetical protein